MSDGYEQMRQDYRNGMIECLRRTIAGEADIPMPSVERLESFCIAGGHDLQELDGFVSEVFEVLSTMLPT